MKVHAGVRFGMVRYGSINLKSLGKSFKMRFAASTIAAITSQWTAKKVEKGSPAGTGKSATTALVSKSATMAITTPVSPQSNGTVRVPIDTVPYRYSEYGR